MSKQTIKLIFSVLLLSSIQGSLIAVGVYGVVTGTFWGLPFFLLGILLTQTMSFWGDSGVEGCTTAGEDKEH